MGVRDARGASGDALEVEVPSGVGGDGKDVASDLDKSWESATSPSGQCNASGVVLAQQFCQVAQELHTRHERGATLVVCPMFGRSFRFWLRRFRFLIHT